MLLCFTHKDIPGHLDFIEFPTTYFIFLRKAKADTEIFKFKMMEEGFKKKKELISPGELKMHLDSWHGQMGNVEFYIKAMLRILSNDSDFQRIIKVRSCLPEF